MEVFLGHTTYNIYINNKLDEEEKEIPETGDKIEVVLKPLTMQDYQYSMPFVNKIQKLSTENVDLMGDASIIKLFKELLPKYVNEIKGIDIVESRSPYKARPCTLEDMFEHGTFFNLLLQIFIKLISISSLSKEQELNVKK